MSLHQIVHIGDTHLQASHPRNADRLAALDQVIAAGLVLPHLAAWAWPGDVFHQKSDIADRNALLERVDLMAGAAPVLIVYGNHDVAGDLDFLVGRNTRYHVYVWDTPKVLPIFLATGVAAWVAGVPYPHKGGLVANDVPPDQIVATGRDALDAICRGLAETVKERPAGEFGLVLAHGNIGGAVASSGQPQIGQEVEFDAPMLQRFGDVPLLFNHVHKPQELFGAIYAGSLCRLDWGESEAKRFVVAELSRIDWTTRSVPVSIPARYYVEGELTRDGFAWRVLGEPGGESQPPPASWAGAEVRVRYSYFAADHAALDVALVRVTFDGAAVLKLDPVPIRDRAIRAPEVAAARTLDAKVAAYGQVNGWTLTDGLRAKLARLQAAPAETVLTEVATSLANGGSDAA